MSPEEKNKIIKVLEEKMANHPCPRCGNQQFTLLDGYISNPLQNEIGNIVIGGPAIPAVGVICNRCGFISYHALGILGLLPPQIEKN